MHVIFQSNIISFVTRHYLFLYLSPVLFRKFPWNLKKKFKLSTFCFGRWHLIARISKFFSDETSQWRVLFTEPHWFLWRILRRVFTRRLSATLSWNRNWTTRNHWPSWYNDSKTKQKVFDASKYHILRWRGVKITTMSGVIMLWIGGRWGKCLLSEMQHRGPRFSICLNEENIAFYEVAFYLFRFIFLITNKNEFSQTVLLKS